MSRRSAQRRFDFGEPLGRRPRARLTALRVEAEELWALRPDLPRVLDDLLDVAMAVYAADRLLSRPHQHGHFGARVLELVVPVTEVERWQALEDELADFLAWLTGDAWHLTFVPGAPRVRVTGGLYPAQHDRPFVGLYSGGLDSLTGAVIQALDPNFDRGILVRATSHPSLTARQQEQWRAVRAAMPEFDWHRALTFRHPLNKRALGDWHRQEQAQEKSQRSRAFLFMAFGAATAHACGVDTLHVYENGVGAINLPLTPAASGADQTLAMHPETLLRLNGLLSTLLGVNFRVVNASLWRTKGEMCALLGEHGLGHLAELTVSCDSYPLREARKQCGTCTSCLLRRVSLLAGDLAAFDLPERHYRHDIRAPHAGFRESDTLPAALMADQVRRLSGALNAPEPARAFQRAFPDIERARHAIAASERLTLAEVDAGLLSLYGRYAGEWANFQATFHDPARAAGREATS
ncbi:hypothetical protein [Deinococcus planocerae]|uniref:hypothetical protein n=1 Tax=Deinococcus planocerae TaxID=1737569 RepID=UPI000C7E922D|nr:hypothetical protein [Deinococcus planocerae]